MTVMKHTNASDMKNDNAPERAVALMNEYLDVLQRVEQAPDSPVNTFLTAKQRRELRRDAKRLRKRQVEPRYKNLHNAEELAGIYERAVQREEIREQGQKDLQRISMELKRIREEKDPDVEKAIGMLFNDAARSAEEHGPGSEAAQRYRHLQFIRWFGQEANAHRREQRAPVPRRVPPARDPSIQARLELSAASILDSPPPGEAVIAIPPEGSDSGRERVFLRIGLGDASWIGSFEIGHMSVGMVSMMPDDKHLFVSAKGAGYIIDLKSRTLVEQIGTDIAAVTGDAAGTLFLVDHNGMSLELFGKAGRLWKTDTISSGGFREISLEDTSIAGEARQASGWTAFSVELTTGEVRFEDRV
jgi:hypothetical protein